MKITKTLENPANSRMTFPSLLVGAAAAALALTASSGAPASAGAYPGDNGRITYTESIQGATDQIWSMYPNDPASKIQLTNNTADNTQSSWSPDGSEVAYVRSTADVRLNDIYVANADGSNARPLVQAVPFGSSPTWSPDGRKIAYTENLGTIKTVDTDGGNKTTLVGADPNGNDFGANPQWSPNGNKIVYSKIIAEDLNCPGKITAHIAVMNTDGSGQQQLTSDRCGSYEPVWSPDGTRIAFTSDRTNNEEVWAMAADGSNQTRLTDDLELDSSPSWSPDGSRIAFDSSRTGAFQIWTMNADGTNQQSTGFEGTFPNWGVEQASETTLTVKAVKKSKKLKVGKKAKLVKSAQTNGDITKVKIVCKTQGDKVKGKKAKKQVCGAKEKKKKDPSTAKIVAKPKCDTKVKIKAVVTAQYQQTDPAKWKRTWKVKNNTGPGC